MPVTHLVLPATLVSGVKILLITPTTEVGSTMSKNSDNIVISSNNVTRILKVEVLLSTKSTPLMTATAPLVSATATAKTPI